MAPQRGKKNGFGLCALNGRLWICTDFCCCKAFKRRIAKWNDAISQWKAAHREEAHDYRAGLALLQNGILFLSDCIFSFSSLLVRNAYLLGKTECVYLQKQAAHILNLSPAAAENELARSSTDTSVCYTAC